MQPRFDAQAFLLDGRAEVENRYARIIPEDGNPVSIAACEDVYSHMFRAVEVVLINKIGLAAYVDFDETYCWAHIAAIDSDARILSVSTKTGEGCQP
ncbi:MAG: hypothetical protein ACR2P3_13030 [Geminicoccaceae bacterium]